MLQPTDGRSRPFLHSAARRIAVLSITALGALLSLAASAQPMPPAEIRLERDSLHLVLVSAREAYTCHIEFRDGGGQDVIARRIDPLAGTTEWRMVVDSLDTRVRNCALDYVETEEVLVAAYDGQNNVRTIWAARIDAQTGAVQTRDSGYGTSSTYPDVGIVVDDNGGVFLTHDRGDAQALLFWSSTTALVNPDVEPRQFPLEIDAPDCFLHVGSADSEIGPDGKVWLTYGQTGASCSQRGFTHVALDVDASGNLVDSCAPGDACIPFLDSFYDDNNLDGSSGRIYADWIEIPFSGSPNREIFAIYPDAFNLGQGLHARVMESGEFPEQIARPINTTIDVETVGGEWILARRNAADTLDIHRFPAGVQADGDAGGLAELGALVTIDSPFCGTETDRDNDAIRVHDDVAGRGLAAVAHYTCDDPAATLTAEGSLVVELIDPDFPDADLAVAIDDGRIQAAPGDTVTYTVVASNAGPEANGHVYLDTALPDAAACSWTSSAAGGATGNAASGSGDLAEVLAMPSGSTVTYAIDCPIDPLAAGTRVADATIDSPASDDPPVEPAADNADSDTTALVPSADLSVTVTESADPVSNGQLLDYTLEIANAGPSTATGVVLDTILSSGLAGATSTGCDEDPGGVGTCTIGALAPGDTATVTIESTVDATAPATVSIDATASGSEDDPAPSDNSDSETTAVVARADVGIELLSSTNTAGPGSALTFTAEVTNSGPDAADAASIAATASAGLVLTETSGCSEDPSGVPSCGVGTLAPGETVTVTYAYDVDAGAPGTLTFDVSVSASPDDPDGGNDQDSATVNFSADVVFVDGFE